jgi:hypothetical protein
MHSERSAMVSALALWLLLPLSVAPVAAQVQPNAVPGSQTSQEAQSQPMTNEPGAQPGARQSGPAVPTAPAPAAQAPGTGNYWYWIAAIAAIIVIFWGVPRFFRAIRSSEPRRRP